MPRFNPVDFLCPRMTQDIDSVISGEAMTGCLDLFLNKEKLNMIRLLLVATLTCIFGCNHSDHEVANRSADTETLAKTTSSSTKKDLPHPTQTETKNMSEATEFLKQYISTQNELQTKFHTEYYQYLVEAEKTDGDSLEDHLRQFGAVFRKSTCAQDQDIKALENKAGVALPSDLVSFYQQVGGFSGTDTHQAIEYGISDCDELLASLQSDKSDRLFSLGLPDGIRYTWGNDRPELLAATSEQPEGRLEQVSKQFKWFGSIRDSHYESGLHFAFDSKGKYYLFYWHQDEYSELEPDVVFDGKFAELLKLCVEGYLAVREIEKEDDEESAYFDLEELVTFLKKTLDQQANAKQ